MWATPANQLSSILGCLIASNVHLGQNFRREVHKTSVKITAKVFLPHLQIQLQVPRFDQYLLQIDILSKAVTAPAVPKMAEGPRTLFSVWVATQNSNPCGRQLDCKSQFVMPNFTIYGCNTLCLEREYQQHTMHQSKG